APALSLVHDGRVELRGRLGPPRLGPVDEAYTAFPSGSTGAPRGVSIGRTALDTIVSAWGSIYRLDIDPGRHLQAAPMSFDVFLGDTARRLGFGGTLVVVDEADLLDPAALLARMADVDTAELVPAVARLVAEDAHAHGVRPPTQRRVLQGSDAQ